MSVNIETKKFATTIQKSCDDFIKKNFDSIVMHLQEEKNDISTISSIHKNSWGVYVFYMTPHKEIVTCQELENLWKPDKNGHRIPNSPQVVKNRCKKPILPLKIGKPVCIYVGKSEDLAKRISEHIHLKKTSQTSALKLFERSKKLHSSNSFEYAYFEIAVEPDSKDGMDCLLRTLEKRLSDDDKFTPLIGKKR